MIIMIRMIRMIISHIGSKLFGYSLIDLSTIDLLSLLNYSPDLEVFEIYFFVMFPKNCHFGAYRIFYIDHKKPIWGVLKGGSPVVTMVVSSH